MSRLSDLGQAVLQVLQASGSLTRAVGNLVAVALGHSITSPQLKGAHFMFVVKDNQADVPYAVAYTVVDAEGQVVAEPVGVVVEVVSDNPGAVSLVPDATDPKKGTAHFGDPGLANVNATVKLADGTLVGSFGAQFTVTVGDPAAIAGGAITFEGLTETP